MNNIGLSALTALPIWATALILYFVTAGGIFLLRDKCEGLYYNTSYSAVLGDGALVVVVLMACGMLQRAGLFLPEWAQSRWFEWFAFLSSTAVGTVWWEIDRPQQWGDTYHHLVIAPIMVYLAAILLPVFYYNATRVEIIFICSLVSVWALLFVYDIRHERLDQRKYRNLGLYLDVIKNLGRKTRSR